MDSNVGQERLSEHGDGAGHVVFCRIEHYLCDRSAGVMECLTLKMPCGKGVNGNTLVQANHALYHSCVTILRATNSFLRSLLAGKQQTGVPKPSPTPGPSGIVEASSDLPSPPVPRSRSLYAFVDLKDPFAAGEIAGEELSGPILSILSARPMSRLYLFHTPDTSDRALLTLEAVRKRHRVVVYEWGIPTSDPKDFSSLMGTMTQTLQRLWRSQGPDILNEENYVCLSSGTAEMRAVWILLITLGVLEAKMLQVGPPANPLFGEVHINEVRTDMEKWEMLRTDMEKWETLRSLVMPEAYYRWHSRRYPELYGQPWPEIGATSGPRDRAPLRSVRSSKTRETLFSSPAKNEKESADVLDLGARKRERAIEIGKKLIEKEARKYRISLQDINEVDFQRVAFDYGLGQQDDLLAAIGYGNYSARQVLRKLAPAPEATTAPEQEEPEIETAGSQSPATPLDETAANLPPIPDIDEALQELGIYVGSAMLRHAAEQAAIAAGSHLPVLLLGETGTGKERFAHLIHKLSPQSEKDLVAINCAAIPESIAESYLFGHVKGSFTGASADKVGMFEQANGSTLFLDEVAELTLDVQAKLLRVIQDGVVQRIGATVPRKVQVRIVAATNRDLRREVAAGKFRQDLYFRLEVVSVRLPGLRERRGEIAELALALLKQINQRRHKPRQLSKDALRRLEGHTWPGNVRELSNVLERSVLYAQNDVVNGDDLLITSDHAGTDILLNLPEPFPGFSIKEYLEGVRKELFLRALAACNGNQGEAAARLGISEQAVSKFVRGIQTTPVEGE